MTKKNYHIDMSGNNLLKNIFLFAIPLMFTTLLQMLFNAADTVVVGKFSGETALAAVGATGSVSFLMIAFFNGLSVGTNVVVSKYIGAKDDIKTSEAVHTSMWMSILASILMTIFGVTLSKPLLRIMSTPESILDLSSLYMRILFLGSGFQLVYDFGAAILRSSGDTKRPMYYLALSGVINVILNLFFVVVLDMSVAGVAIATVISQGIATVLTVITLLNETNATKVYLNKIKYNAEITKEILIIGVPAGINGIVFSLSNVVVQSSINSFDNNSIIAANAAAVNLENFVYIGMDAFCKATATFTAANVGAKNYQQIKKVLWFTMFLTLLSGFLVSLLIYFNGNTFLGLYTNEPEVIYYGMYRLAIVTALLPIQGISDAFIGSLRGMGYSTLPTIMMLIGICGVRLVWLFTIFPLFRSIEILYACFPISWTLTGIIQGVLWAIVYRKYSNS